VSTFANPIAVAGLESAKVEISTDAYSRREAVLDTALFCPPAVTDADTQTEVTHAVRDIKRLLKEVEEGRQAAKAPALDIGRKIDAAAKEFVATLEAEANRLTGLLVAYETQQQRIAREAEAKRQAEIRRQEAEARAAKIEIERKAREAEVARQAAERAAREATNAQARAKAQEEARKAQEEQQQAAAEKAKQEEAQRLQQAETLRAPAPAVTRAAGTAASSPWVFDVIDIKALHAARPELVDLVIRRQDTITRIRQGEREIPGLRIYQDTRVTVRT